MTNGVKWYRDNSTPQNVLVHWSRMTGVVIQILNTALISNRYYISVWNLILKDRNSFINMFYYSKYMKLKMYVILFKISKTYNDKNIGKKV